VLKDRVSFEISKTIRIFEERLGCEVVELNVQVDHMHLIDNLRRKVSRQQYSGRFHGSGPSMSDMNIHVTIRTETKKNRLEKPLLDRISSPGRDDSFSSTRLTLL